MGETQGVRTCNMCGQAPEDGWFNDAGCCRACVREAIHKRDARWARSKKWYVIAFVAAILFWGAVIIAYYAGA